MIAEKSKKTGSVAGLLPNAEQSAVLLLCPPESKPATAPPIVGGFQMPLPGFPGGSTDEKERAASHEWHYYLGSR
jgi:hypothetical protein